MTHLQPTSISDRITSLDVIRGIAVLGILLMNIQSFSMIDAAYINPMARGEMTGADLIVWFLTHLLADQKFMSLFSILFGTGIILFLSNKEGRPGMRHYYKRIAYLLLFGLLHAYLLWHGDILVTYALCGFWVVLLRHKSPRTLIRLAVILLSVPVLLNLWTGLSMGYIPEESLKGMQESWSPSMEQIQEETRAFQGSWIEQMEFRVPFSLEYQTFLFLYLFGWKASGMMLLGMALFKNGTLSMQKSSGYYRNMAMIAIPLGMTITAVGASMNFANNWSMEYSLSFGSIFNYTGAIITSLGYIGLISLFSTRKVMIYLFQPVGRMAFTIYILQTLICTLIFYGHGLGLYGQVNIVEQLLVVAGCWVFLLVFARLWLSRFRFGPIEWVWRSLTYGKVLGISKRIPK